MTTPRPRTTALLVAAVVAVGTAGCTGSDPGAAAAADAGGSVGVVQPGAPGEPSQRLDEAPDHRVPEHTDADVVFARGMIAHHVQALRMTRLVPARTSRDDLPRFAERMDLSQEAELELLQGWLERRGEPVPSLSAPHDHGGGDAADDAALGMLSEDELLALEAAEGADFDRRFLEGMIRHHEGALVMVEQLYAAGGGQEPEMARFAAHVQADQEVELGRMREMLAGLAAR